MGRTGWIRATGVAAIAGALCWLVKWVTLVAQDGGESWIDRTAFGIGLLLVLIGSLSLSLRLTRHRGAGVTAVVCVAVATVTFLLVGGLSIVSNAVFGETTFVGTEGGLTLLALLSLAVGITGVRARYEPAWVA